MKHTVNHGIEKPLARKATEKALEAYKERFAEYNPTVEWTTEDQANVQFKAKGMTLKGNFELTDDDVNIEMDVPLLMRPFRKLAVDVVEKEILAWVQKAKEGEFDV